MNETGGHSMCQAFDEIEEMAAEKAKIKERTDIINNMLGNGMSVDDISRVTNIPIEDVKTLVME
ncbi:MAG: hypothetical protein K6G57_00565 [Lachnospiraceae bacterium]|nr:hypothetical protein [Lachnospiraceae bacterium]